METENYLIKVYNINSGQTSVHELKTEETLHPDNGNVIWNLEFDFFGEEMKTTGAYFLSGAMDRLREIIEPKGYRVLVKCADHDAAHSGMQADMTAGSKIFKLKLLDELRKQSDPKKNPIIEATFHVFDESDITAVATLQQQNDFRADYFKGK